MLRRLSYPSTLLAPPIVCARLLSLSYVPRMSCHLLWGMSCWRCHCFFFWMVITAAFFPLQSITLRYDGCLLAKHKHLRFRLAKRRVILLKSKLPFILSEIVAPLVCQPKAASTWTLSRCYDAWLPLNGGFQKSLRVIYTARARSPDGSREERSAPPLPVEPGFSVSLLAPFFLNRR